MIFKSCSFYVTTLFYGGSTVIYDPVKMHFKIVYFATLCTKYFENETIQKSNCNDLIMNF